MILPAIAAILPSLVEAVAKEFITRGAALRYVDLAVGLLSAGLATPSKMAQLDAEIRGFVARNEAPGAEWWAAHRVLSDQAHGDIQNAAEQAG